MKVPLEKQFPEVNFQWFQSGSENVAARVNAELSTGRSQADLILTSDVFWYLELKKGGHLLPYKSPAAQSIPANFRDKDHAFTLVRMPVAIIAYHPDVITASDVPQSWDDLKNPGLKGKISMGSPLESGTAMLIVSQLEKKKGWDYFKELKKNQLLSTGGNSGVISRIETKERPIGLTLLENVLEAQARKSPIAVHYPSDGAILVPSPIAILSKTTDPELTKRIYDYFFSPAIQELVVRGRMYSPVLTEQSPQGGTKAYSEILRTAFEWSPQLVEDLYSKREKTKEAFVQTILN